MRPWQGARAVRDVLAGLQLAALNIPQALGYTKIAGTPIITGFYTLLLPAIAFAALGSSRYLVVAADSATAAILFSGLSRMAPVASPHYVELASLVALLTAVLLLIARLAKLGFLADFLSRTVLVGFLAGVGLQVATAVLGGMLGLEIASHRTLGQLAEVLAHLRHVNRPTLLISFVVVAGILTIRGFVPKFPAAMLFVIAAIFASKLWNFAGHGITVIGAVMGGLPHFVLPSVTWREAESLVGVAGSCFVMIIAQSAATARIYAERHGQHLDENADILGLSAANAAAGLSGTFVVNGSPTQTAMVESSGANSQLAQISTSAVVALVLLFLTGPLQYLPRCVLSSIVFVIAVRLIDLRKLWAIRRESPGEFGLAVMTAAVVVVVGVEQGIIVAMVVSLARIVHHSYRPHTGVLEAVGDMYWKILPAAPGAMTRPGLTIYRFGAPLFYANAPFFAEEIHTILQPPASPIRWLVVDAEAITNLDYTAARVVRDLQRELASRAVTLAFARVSTFLRADFDRHGVTAVVGEQLLFSRLHDALDAFEKSSAHD